MRNHVVSCIALVFIAAVCLVSGSFLDLVPANGSSVNDCPYFSWKATDVFSDFNVSIWKTDETWEKVVNVPSMKLDATPWDMSTLLGLGEYKWKVSHGSEESYVHSFTVASKSCVPPYVKNPIDNTLPGRGNQQTYDASGKKISLQIFEFAACDNYTVQTSENASTPFEVCAPDHENGGLMMLLKVRETYDNESKTEAANSTIKFDAKAGSYFNSFGFRYIFFSNGDSTVTIELVTATGEVVQFIDCIGGLDPNCRDSNTEAHKMHVSPYMPAGLWSYMTYFFPPRDKESLFVRFTYKRAPRSSTETPPGARAANFMMFLSSFTFGQCSSYTDDDFFSENATITTYNTSCASGECSCTRCPSAQVKVPMEYVSQCKYCGEVENPNECSSVDYCTYCYSAGSKCLNASDLTCRASADCGSKKTKGNCESSADCAWCPVDDTCVFKEDASSCTTCEMLVNKSQCEEESYSQCSWCSVQQQCHESTYTCPDCSYIKNEDSCILAKTDDVCQWCRSAQMCLSAEAVCNPNCTNETLISNESLCISETDCQWCGSKQQCMEYRTECKNCINISKVDCLPDLYPGCAWCSTDVCLNITEHCPLCDELTVDTCEMYEGHVMSCMYCNSSKKCLWLNQTCKVCSKLSEAECGKYDGCFYCKSDKKCQDSYESCQECHGMSQTVCNRHLAGCCWSTSDEACYNIGNEKCENGLGLVYIIIIVVVCVIVVVAAVLIPTLICCCKKKEGEGIEMTAPGTIVVLPEGQPSMVVAQESLQSVNLDPATAVSIDASGAAPPASTTSAQLASGNAMDMQTMMAQQQQLMMQQQMSMMMNPMMMNSMMNMSGMNGMNSMGMNSMGMDMSGMGMNGMGMNGMGMNGMGMNGMGMNSMSMDMNSMSMTGGMQGMPAQGQATASTSAAPAAGGAAQAPAAK